MSPGVHTSRCYLDDTMATYTSRAAYNSLCGSKFSKSEYHSGDRGNSGWNTYCVSVRWSGIAAIIFYASTIFSNAGYSPRKSQWLSGLNYVRIIRCATYWYTYTDPM